MKTDAKIEHVSDTALWVAHCRAVESSRPDALFNDSFAQVLAGSRGENISDGMGVAGQYTMWNLAIRTVIIDRFVESMIASGVDLVLNLGAGLDTRPYRMKLPESLLWIEVDHPHLIDHKEKILRSESPTCRLERHRIDLADGDLRRRFLAETGKRAANILVLTEGVLPYLTETQVSELAEDLLAVPTFHYWIVEYFSGFVYRYLRTRVSRKRMGKAPFQFFPAEWFAFFKKHGWNEKETRYLAEESFKLNRKPPSPWWSFIFVLFMSKANREKYMKMSGYSILTRGN